MVYNIPNHIPEMEEAKAGVYVCPECDHIEQKMPDHERCPECLRRYEDGEGPEA